MSRDERLEFRARQRITGRIVRVAENDQISRLDRVAEPRRIEDEILLLPQPEFDNRQTAVPARLRIPEIPRRHNQRPLRAGERRQQVQKQVRPVPGDDARRGEAPPLRQHRNQRLRIRLRIFPEPVEAAEAGFENAGRRPERIQIHAEVENFPGFAPGQFRQFRKVSAMFDHHCNLHKITTAAAVSTIRVPTPATAITAPSQRG